MILCVSQDITWRIILRPMLDLALLRVVDHAIDSSRGCKGIRFRPP